MLARHMLSTLALRRSAGLAARSLTAMQPTATFIHRVRASAPFAHGMSQRTTLYSTSAGDDKQPEVEPATGFLDRVVEKLNDGIRKNPAETIAVLFASDIGSIGAMYGLLSVTGIEFSPEFALAFAASRPFRRIRLPLDLASAAVVAKVFPAFSRVRLSELTNVMPGSRERMAAAGGNSSIVSKSMDKMFSVVDSYGAAYMMGSRLMGVSVVTALYFLIKQGVDVMPLLAKLGVDEVGSALGSYAAAVVFSSAFYPVTLGITGYVVPIVAKARRTLLPMAPSKKRSVIDAKPVTRRRVGPRACPCLTRPHSDGICELNVWQGTTIEPPDDAKLLHRHMRVVKYKDLTLESFSGYMYLMVMLRWLPLLALFGAIYIAVVGVFALLFALCNADLTVPDAKPRDYFNLSVQTMATIGAGFGYGVLFPKDSCSNWVAVIESFVSMIVISLMTGIAFVKFARPRSQIICSDVFTVSQREGAPDAGLEMRFRVVNGTRRELIMRGEILEVSFKLVLMRIEETKSGEKRLCYYDLHLKTTSYITLRLEAEIIHEIEEDSPLFGMTQEDVAKSDFLIILMMSGVDETLHDTVHKQFEFTYDSMRWGAKFVPILTWDRLANHIELDFQHISAVVSAPIKQATQQGDVQIVVEENMANNSTLSTETEGNMDMAAELENVADSDHEDGTRLLRHTQLLLSLPNGGTDTGIDYSDLESMISYRDDAPLASDSPGISPDDGDDTENHTNSEGDEDDESKSAESMRTNSGSENEERHETTPMHHVRFDRRIRTTSFRVPRISRRHRDHNNPQEPNGSSHRHTHESHQDLHDEPMSLMRRRVRFKNHPLSRFSKGLYYRALETSWLRVFVYLAFIYFSAIAVMALLMHLSARHAVVNTAGVEVDNHYERIFFFCAQTISTIGYGSLAPKPQSDLMNFYVCILSIAGMVVSTLVTGLAWAKFSIPKASTIAFSDYLLLTAFHSHRAIVFRAANRRTYGAIIECSFRVSVVILNQRLGHKETHELKLVRNVWPVVQLATTVTHIIDEDSPLYNIPTDELLSGRHFFVVLFSGLDPVVGENMFSRKTYHSCDILVGHHFVDNIKLTSEGVHVDLEAINGTTLTPEIDLRESRLYPASATSPPPESSPVTEPTCDTFFVEPYEAQRRRRREADEEESIAVTPRAAQYALM